MAISKDVSMSSAAASTTASTAASKPASTAALTKTKKSRTLGNAAGLSDRIAELAYFKAEARGFRPGHELDDWLEAEEEVRAAARPTTNQRAIRASRGV